MLIDWFTVVAQIVNFLALVALLKHFLFGRLVRAIDSREKRIAARLAEADRKNRDAEQQVEAAHAETERLHQERDRMIADAKQEAESQRKQMVQSARESVRALEAKWREDLEREKTAFLDEVRSRASNEILAITRRALADLACADLQRCAIDSFLEQLQSADAASLGNDLVLRSGKDLPEDTRHRIEETIHERLGAAARLRFERAPQMAWGLELRANGRRIGWNPENYIGILEENLRQSLEHHTG